MKRLAKAMTALLCIAALLSCFSFIAVADTHDTVARIRHNIDRHMSDLQKKNGELLKMSAEDIAAADYAEYDTSNNVIGTDLFDLEEPSGVAYGKNIEDVLKGKENKITTLKSAEYKVHSIQQYGKYPDIFPDDSVLRAEDGNRASLIQEYPEDVPSYQIVKDKKNVYVENINFYDFPTIKFENCSNIIINNCTFNNFADNGLVFRNCSSISVLNCEFVDCGNQMSDYTNSGYSIRIAADSDIKSENILIENCDFKNSCGKAISFVGSVDNYVIRNNRIDDSVWGAIDYWQPSVSGNYVNIIENNECTDIGFGKPSVNDTNALSSGVGCAAIYAGMGTSLPKTIVKNNVVKNAVETAIEGPYELVYHNTIKNTGENSAKRYTDSTEAIFIKPSVEFEQKYIANDIETKGLRCFSSYSDRDEEYKGIYILNNTLSLQDTNSSITCNYNRSDIEINCKKLRKLVIRDNKGMMQDKPGVDIYIKNKDYVMDYLDIENPCMIGNMPKSARYYFNINNM